MGKFSIVKGDIVKSKTEAIVNAANTSLLGGGGVDGAIHRAAGPGLLEECRRLNGCERGKAKITNGYKLKAKYVIHTPGPIWRGGSWSEKEILASCYKSCLNLALDNNIKTITFPSISTGVYRFPVEIAADIAVNEILNFMYQHSEIEEVFIYCFDDETTKIYKEAYKNIVNKQKILWF